MCGIVGYVGNKDIDSVIIVGLQKLEYRGYDSAGISAFRNGNIFVMKKKGRISTLAQSLNGISLDSGIGIGHTRWATHGKPSDSNAHPHTDCKRRFAVVHNGIIENFQTIKKKLITKGHRFISNTDTEVIAHLLEEADNGNFLQTVLKAIKQLRGSFALGILYKDSPQTLIGVRMGSPLIVGIGKDENLIASDIPAILSHTRKIIPLHDEEIATLTGNEVSVYNFSGNKKRRRARTVDWEEDMIEKGGYPHFMLKEIHEQPRVISENLRRYTLKGYIDLPDEKIFQTLSNPKSVIFQSAGTSYHASLYGKHLFEQYLKILTVSDVSSEFRYREPVVPKGSVLIVISQSGETADTLAGLQMGKKKGLPIISLVNVRDSTIDRESGHTIYLNAGPEIGVASTKAYTAQLLHLLLLTIYIARKKGYITDKEEREILLELKNIPEKIRFILGREDEISLIARKYYESNHALFLGRGLMFPTALEGALKLKEISYIHASGYAAGEMKHGPIALIDKTWPVICIIPRNQLYDKMLSNIMEVKARGAKVITVATYKDSNIPEFSEDVLWIPKTIPLLEPILAIIPLQLLAYHIALLRGCDVDKPRNLAKSVTVE